MIIKKFLGKTKEDAMARATAELGDNFIVMNEKSEVRQKGFLSFLKPKLYEITVAKEEEDAATINPAKNASDDAGKDTITKEQAASIKETIASVDKLRKLSEQQEMESKTVDIKVPAAEPVKAAEKKEEVKADKPVTYTKSDVIAKPESKEQADTSGEQAPNRDMLDFLRLLYNTMTDNEVSEKYANQMIDEVSRTFDEEMNMEYILSHIYQKMILKFGKNETIEPSSSKTPKVVFFIGPTGVGKTTTLAKIASKLKVMERKNVAMFTADTYRIAATDQLNTYAQIMETPFHIIYTLEDLEKCYDLYKEYDYILVDTAGHSHHNEEQKKAVSDFIRFFDGKAETEVYLVLSATTKYRDLVSISDAYKSVADYRLIFTKLDETDVYGNLLNLRIYTEAPMSYVTCGQNVPDDIEKFSPQNIVKKLLGGENLSGDK